MNQDRIAIRLLGLLLGATALCLSAAAQVDSLRQEMMRGNLSGMESYIGGLSKSQRRTFDNRVRLTELGLAQYDLEEATDQLGGLESLRRLTESQEEVIERLSHRISTAERIYPGLVRMQLYGRETGAEERMIERLTGETSHLGQIGRDRFVSADRREQWRVVSDTTALDHFVVVSRLGDGSWDSEGARTVQVLGLEGGKLAFPYLAPDGETITFAYRGPESLGGYDLFVSRYDREESKILVPQQLSAPYNTLADDYALLRDDERQVDWLLSDRGTSPSDLALYALSSATERQDQITAELGWLLGDSILQSVTALPALTRSTTPKQEEVREPLFRVGTTPIDGVESFTSREAQHFLREYIEKSESLTGTLKRLSELRKSYARDKSGRDTILSLEQQEQSLRRELSELRNKVISLEKLMK